MSIRVLLADDHPVFRDGLRFVLAAAADVEVAGEAVDGEDAVRLATESAYDVVVMDVRMPRLDGIQATRAVVTTGARVLVLTMSEDDTTVVAALRAGASGYLVKGADAEQVVSAIRAVADGHAVLGKGVASNVLQQLDRPEAEPLPDLSTREREILELVALGMTNPEIGARLFISPVTVRNHVSRILAKLQVRDRREAMLRVRGQGPLPGEAPGRGPGSPAR